MTRTRPRVVFAFPAFADDDENVVHLTVVEPCAALLDPGGDEAVRVVTSGTAGTSSLPSMTGLPPASVSRAEVIDTQSADTPINFP